MRMIPPVIDINAPHGEKEIFQLLKTTKIRYFDNCIVFHSLNYPQSIKKSQKKSYSFFGESDFVIFVPNKGVINIEVKGGGVSRVDGEWYTEDRYGKHKIKDPFKQASKSLFNISNYFKKKNIFVPQDYLVIFPDCDFEYESIEIPPDNLVSGEINPKLIKALSKIINEHLLETNGKFFPKKSDEVKLLNIIRPNFDPISSNKNLLNQSKKQIEKYTNEQITILENFNAKRLIVNGSQGTGKTIIAEEIAKQKLLQGSVLFISSGRLRNEETKQRFKEFDNFHCFTFHNFIHKVMKDIVKKEIPKNLTNKINSLKFEDKTEFFLKFISDNILDAENLTKYDYLIMDEVQNYCHYQEFYGVIGSILNGDLKEGNWFLFGDFDFQNLWSAKKSDELIKTNPKNYLNNFKDYYYFLNYNVRNAQQITVHAPLISGIFEGKFPSRPFFIKIEGSIKHHYGKNEKEKIFKLEKIIEDFYNQQINGSDIVILSSYRIENTKNILGKSNISKFYKVVDLTKIKTFGKEIIEPSNKNSIYFSTIQGFQGMESKIVVLLNPLSSPVEDISEKFVEYKYGKDFKNLITYNAMGRANTLLHIIWDKIHEKYISQQIGKALKLQDEILNG